MAVYHAKADLDEAEANSKRLEAEVDDLLELCNALDARLDELSAARAERDNLAAERKRLAAENAKLRTENDVLRRDYGIKRRQYDEMQAALKALQNDLR
jgi:cell division protein FtsB